MAHRLSDQLAAAAPGEYVQLAISLANEKPLERPNISDALQECTRVTIQDRFHLDHWNGPEFI